MITKSESSFLDENIHDDKFDNYNKLMDKL